MAHRLTYCLLLALITLSAELIRAEGSAVSGHSAARGHYQGFPDALSPLAGPSAYPPPEVLGQASPCPHSLLPQPLGLVHPQTPAVQPEAWLGEAGAHVPAGRLVVYHHRRRTLYPFHSFL